MATGTGRRSESTWVTRPGRGVLLALLSGTFLGTVTNNVVNVPLAEITRGYRAPLAEGILVVSSFVLVLASTMPLTGWISDRFGRRRTLTVSLVMLAAGLLGSAAAPNLPLLVGTRALQALACAAIAPAVMGALAVLFASQERARAMSAWAAANGLGQALGPPLGGLVTSTLGWRAIFLLLAPVALVTSAATARLAPPDRAASAPLHWPGAGALTLGASLVMVAITAASQRWLAWWVCAGIAVVGVGALGLFFSLSTRAPAPLINPRLLAETRFLRSSTAAFVQMVALAVVLVAVPLYATNRLGMPPAEVGVLVFALPTAMVVAARPVGSLADALGPRRVMRVGLLVLASSQLGLAMLTGSAVSAPSALVAVLILVGLGVASVQTPSAAGATRSPAGRSGAALGLFNMIRFAGSAVGAAWVAALIPRQAYAAVFLGSSLLALAGWVVTFLGSEPRGDELVSDATSLEAEIRPA